MDLQNQTDTLVTPQREAAVKRAIARQLARSSLFYLGRDILGYDKFGPSQVKWDIWAREYIDFTGKTSGKFIILQPRETYKTTFFTISLAICFLLNNPELSILIANERAENANDILKEIKDHFEKNEKLHYLFGHWVSPNSWATTSMRLAVKRMNYKEPSVWTAGVGSAVTSKHPDIIICDDIAGKKDKESEAGRAQTLSFFQDTWDLLKKDTGTFIMPGTRKHINDIYAHIKNNLNPQLIRAGLQPFTILEMPAHENGNPESKVLNFPDILSNEKLAELRIVKEGKDGVDYSTYMAEYELNPLDPATQIFKTFHYIDHKVLKFDRLCQWTDPAMSQDKTSDYSAIEVLGRIAEGEYKGKYCLVYASIDKRPLTKLVLDHNRIYRMLEHMYPDIEYQVFMEENGFQALKELAVLKSLQDKEEVPVPTRGRANTVKKETRIESIEPAVSTGMILFREDWASAPENYKLVLDQLRDYPQGKRDGPDALHGAYKNCNSRGTQLR